MPELSALFTAAAEFDRYLTAEEIADRDEALKEANAAAIATPDRAALIGRHLGVSRPYSPAASDLIDQFQLLLADVATLEPAEQARMLAALGFQVCGMATKLHG